MKIIKAIETTHYGVRFRSRLEARWAIALTELGWKWEYEPEGFDLGCGLLYVPDFFVYGHLGRAYGIWLEIKPFEPNTSELIKARELAVRGQTSCVFGIGPPTLEIFKHGFKGYTANDAGQELRWLELCVSLGCVALYAGHPIALSQRSYRLDYVRHHEACEAAAKMRFR